MSTPSLVDTFLETAEQRWWALKTGRQMATLGLIAIAGVAGVLEWLS